MSQPILTIGMIFKNDVRSLARCLEALTPLRRQLPCELVMADTGSTDGSRAIAERYADLLFDFPWVNDFAAARNAVMDRASGAWFFTVDADEYLEGDITELVDFLTSGLSREAAVAKVVQRNYDTYEMDGAYSDFMAMRLLRMSTGMRYEGTIHESWKPVKGEFGRELGVVYLSRTILHHDGYVGLGDERGRAKRERNLKLLKTVLESAPDDLFRLNQYIESGREEADILDDVRRALALTEAKAPRWKTCGPSLFRHAVTIAGDRELPELEEWARRAEELFPDSFCTRIDVAQAAFGGSWARQDFAGCVRRGEACLNAYAESRSDPVLTAEFQKDALVYGSPSHERNLRLFTAFACQKQGQPERALEHLGALDFRQLNDRQAGVLARLLPALYAENGADTARLVRDAWAGITAPVPDQVRANTRRELFTRVGLEAFAARTEETARPPYGAFSPLAGVCALGDGAAAALSREPREIGELLGRVNRWDEFPVPALAHALRLGVPFPPPGCPLNLETLDDLAGRLSQSPEDFSLALERAAEQEDLLAMSWARALALAGVQTCKWEDEAEGMALVRRFAAAERAFLPRCYAPEVLTEKGLCLLPPMHRFGWCLCRAMDALDGGDAAGYARLLRQGLAFCESAKPMAEFLLEHTPELRMPKPSPELLELAEKVRMMLSAYPSDDPAVAALKASPAYQKVAYLIEGDGR